MHIQHFSQMFGKYHQLFLSSNAKGTSFLTARLKTSFWFIFRRLGCAFDQLVPLPFLELKVTNFLGTFVSCFTEAFVADIKWQVDDNRQKLLTFTINWALWDMEPSDSYAISLWLTAKAIWPSWTWRNTLSIKNVDFMLHNTKCYSNIKAASTSFVLIATLLFFGESFFVIQ